MLLVPFLDLATNIWPLRPGDLAWRYGAVGLLSGFLLTPLIAVCMAAGVAATAPHPRVLRSISILSVVLAVGLLMLTLMFSLDVIQFRLQVPPEGQGAYRLGAARAWIKNMLVVAALGWLALGCRNAARASTPRG